MQAIKSAVAVFCTACICAEVLSQLLGGTRLRSCIKAVAGLYILVSVLHALPGLGAQARSFSLPEPPAASFGSLEETVLRQTERQLAQELERRILEQTGCKASLTVALVQQQGNVAAAAVQAALPAGCTDRQRTAIAALLRQELGTENITFVDGEDVT